MTAVRKGRKRGRNGEMELEDAVRKRGMRRGSENEDVGVAESKSGKKCEENERKKYKE